MMGLKQTAMKQIKASVRLSCQVVFGCQTRSGSDSRGIQYSPLFQPWQGMHKDKCVLRSPQPSFAYLATSLFRHKLLSPPYSVGLFLDPSCPCISSCSSGVVLRFFSDPNVCLYFQRSPTGDHILFFSLSNTLTSKHEVYSGEASNDLQGGALGESSGCCLL